MSFEDAWQRAVAARRDLVEVAPKAVPPVCRIMDFGKYRYEQRRRQRDAKKKQHHHQKLKEIKFHPNIDTHDYQTKLRHAIAFLENGDKVKVSMFFRGREMAHMGLGDGLMQRVIADTAETASVDAPPRRSGRMLSMMLSPRAQKH